MYCQNDLHNCFDGSQFFWKGRAIESVARLLWRLKCSWVIGFSGLGLVSGELVEFHCNTSTMLTDDLAADVGQSASIKVADAALFKAKPLCAEAGGGDFAVGQVDRQRIVKQGDEVVGGGFDSFHGFVVGL